MNEKTIRSALQIVAVVSALVGAVMTSSALLMFVGYSRAVAQMNIGTSQGFSSATNNLSVLGVLSATMPLLWGAALYFASPRIAAHIHGSNSQTNQAM